MKEEDKSKLVEVFTGSPWEAELVKSLLGNSDIEAVTKDGMVVNVVLPATAVDVSVLVNEKDYVLTALSTSPACPLWWTR